MSAARDANTARQEAAKAKELAEAAQQQAVQAKQDSDRALNQLGVDPSAPAPTPGSIEVEFPMDAPINSDANQFRPCRTGDDDQLSFAR
jgi:hypothetical protein